ncbi:MAG: hypothetical protein AABX70_00805 [Nanoarchaeota archaeon]
MPLPARKLEKAVTPQDQTAEMSTLYLLAQHWFNTLTSRARVAYDTGTRNWAKKMGTRNIPYDLLDQSAHIDSLTEEIHKAHVEHLGVMLKQQTGKPYGPLNDQTVQKYLGWALFQETRDTIQQGIGASGANYSVNQHEANLIEHIKRQKGKLYALVTQEVIKDPNQVTALLKYLNLDPETLPGLQGQAIYQKTIERLKETARKDTPPPREGGLETRVGDYDNIGDSEDSAYQLEYDEAA